MSCYFNGLDVYSTNVKPEKGTRVKLGTYVCDGTMTRSFWTSKDAFRWLHPHGKDKDKDITYKETPESVRVCNNCNNRLKTNRDTIELLDDDTLHVPDRIEYPSTRPFDMMFDGNGPMNKIKRPDNLLKNIREELCAEAGLDKDDSTKKEIKQMLDAATKHMEKHIGTITNDNDTPTKDLITDLITHSNVEKNIQLDKTNENVRAVVEEMIRHIATQLILEYFQ